MSEIQFIDLHAQQKQIRPQIDAAIKKVLDHGKYIMGPEVAELEDLLAEFVGVKHCIGVASGTDALLVALMAYGVGPGDAIFTTPFTFFATCEVIALTGATPVFVDIDPQTFNIDPAKLEIAVEKLQNQPTLGMKEPLVAKGIIPVDLFGLPADYDPIMAVAEKYNLFVLEDAAQSFGATYKGRKAPGLAHIGATSFFPAKPLGCYGDGGALFTDDDNLARLIRSLQVHGKGSDKYNNVRVGLNARLDTMQAAILIEKLKIYPEEISLRQKISRYYTEAIASQPQRVPLTPPFTPDGYTSAWAQYTVCCDDREKLLQVLQSAGIPSMIYYAKPMHMLDALSYLGYTNGDFPIAEQVSCYVLSLPFYPYLTMQQQDKILNCLVE